MELLPKNYRIVVGGYLPKEYPPWQTVYMYYRSWIKENVIKKIHNFLVNSLRTVEGRKNKASVLILDSQSIKARFGEQRGFDGFKKIMGRKRSIFVDTMGLIHSVRVSTAQKGDANLAQEMLDPASHYYPIGIRKKLSAFYADAGYRGEDFKYKIKKSFGVFPTMKKSESKQIINHDPTRKTAWTYRPIVVHSNLKPTRWIVERTFAWLGNYRRLNRDYEKSTLGSETMIQTAMTQLMLKRLFRPKNEYKRWN